PAPPSEAEPGAAPEASPAPEPDPAFEQPPVGIDVGQTAPDFTLNLRGGGTVTLWELRGAPVLLNVFTTWCPPCQLEYPEIQAVHDAYVGRAAVLGVDIGEPEADVDEFFDELDYSYAIAYDPYSEIGGDYKIDFIPQTWIIDANGVITDYIGGATDYSEFSASLEEALE
ncbi:MAG: redoxin domain-containing protein, partial [Clostridiales bacterium]|nr:redoxin domain-containing protein [Clostridiales bacterium]